MLHESAPVRTSLAALALALAAGPVAAPLLPAQSTLAQSTRPAARTPAAQAADQYVSAHRAEILREFTTFLSLPNVATDSVAIRRNADTLVAMLSRRGVHTRLLESPTGGPPVVFGELASPSARRTVVFYAHYDGQPVDPAAWATPPWSPTLRDAPLEQGGQKLPLPTTNEPTGAEWRLYARSAGDDKAAIVAMLTGLDALRAAHLAPDVNLKFFFEGEEEQGSPHTRALVAAHRDELRADGWVFSDGPVHQSRRPQILFGVRGITEVTMTLYGASRALHSGHYGNWVPNPAVQLAGLVASMRDANGRILIPGFYDDVRPLSASDRAALASVPDVDSLLRHDLLLHRTEANNARLAERILLPALNVRALHAGPSAGVANAIPTDAMASIDFRLVPDETPERVRQLVESHATRQGFHVVHARPDSATRLAFANVLWMQWGDGYAAQRTVADDPFARAVVHAADATLGAPVIRVPSMGGSAPTIFFAEELHAPLVIVPIANHDDNQHAANENLRLQNLWDGIRLFAGLEATLGAGW